MTLSDFRAGHHPIDDVAGATFTTPGYPAITQITFLACRAQYPGGSNRCDCRFLPCSCCLPRFNGRVGIRNFTFEACSSFTHVAAYQIAARLKSGHLSRGSDPVSYPTKPLGSYHAHRRLHGWVLPPLAICAVAAHRQPEGSQL